MQTVIIVIHLMIVLALVGAVLLQKSEGGGLGIGGGGGGGGFLSSRGTSNMLTRTTAILAGSFFATSLVLSILANMDRKPSAIIRTDSPAQQTPGAPAPTSGGVLDTLRQQEQTPAGPQVPRSQ